MGETKMSASKDGRWADFGLFIMIQLRLLLTMLSTNLYSLLRSVYPVIIASFGLDMLYEISSEDEKVEEMNKEDRVSSITPSLKDSQLQELLSALMKKCEQAAKLLPKTTSAVGAAAKLMDDTQTTQIKFDMQYYEPWREQRRLTLKEIPEIRQKLDDICLYANYVKASGDTAAIAGGAALILGLIHPGLRCALGAATSLKLFGDVIVPLATVVENMLSEGYIADLKSTFQKEEKLSSQLLKSLDYASRLRESFQNTFKCNLGLDTADKVQTSITNEIELMESMAEGMEFGMKVKPNKVFNPEKISQFRNLAASLKQIRERFKNPRYYRVIESSLQILIASEGDGYVSFDKTGACLLTLQYCLSYFLDGDFLALECLSQVRNIAQHCISLNKAIRIAKEGKSEYHGPLVTLEKHLRKEMETIERLH